jgi:hypothetical protein
MFMFHRQMGRQVDSKRKRVAIPGRGVPYLLVCICTPVHICLCFFSCGQMGGQGNSKRAGVRAIGVGYTHSGERTVSCRQMDGRRNRERAGARAISVSGAGFWSQHTFARACE